MSSTHSSNSSQEAPAAAARTEASSPPLPGPLLRVTELVDRCLAEQARSARTRLSPEDVEGLKICFSGQTANCYVCLCLASVYQRVDQPAEGRQQQQQQQWRLTCNWGALVLMMPSFQPEQKFAHSELLLVQLGACLPLWSLRVHSATQYSQTHLYFQTVTDPTGQSVYGLAFLDSDAATEFSSRLCDRLRAMAEFECTSMKERRRTFREKDRRSKSLRRLLSRSRSSGNGGFSEISSPCICQRVASATAQDCDRLSEILALTAELQIAPVATETAETAATTAASEGSSASASAH